MAERSFVHEVQKLRAPGGERFYGEGILAVTRGLLQSGVAYVGGYQGAPISHLMDVLGDAQKEGILDEFDVHFESSASEACAAAMLAASVNYPLRGAITFKSTVGTNVASDALANLASGGVTGGALIIVGEDYGEGSSIMQERSHAFAMKSQIWLLDPRPELPMIVDMVEHGFALSEASNTPVMLELRIRGCHVYGSFETRENKKPPLRLKDAMENPVRDVNRIVLPPASFLHEKEKIEQRLPAAIRYVEQHGLNEFFPGDVERLGIIMQGGLYNTALRALELLGLADIFGASRIPLYVMNVTYPYLDDEVERFCKDKDAVLLLEEGQPNFIEQGLDSILRKRGVGAVLHGKDMLPMTGDYSSTVVGDGIRSFLERYAPELVKASSQDAAPEPAPAATVAIPPRPPGLCTGCPERPVFTAMQLVERELGKLHVSCDIGCHLFSILPPFNIGNTTMGYGLGASGAAAFRSDEASKRVISVMGDGGFWHNGLTSGVGNAVFNKNDNVIVIVDNGYSSATGGQDIPSSGAWNPKRSTRNPIERAARGVGVKWARTVRTYDLKKMKKALTEALTTKADGPKVIVAQSECMLNKQRRVKPLFEKAKKAGQRVVKERFGVDPETCTGDHSCIRLSGCPSLSVKENPDPLRVDPIAHVEQSCVGCGHCGEVADAAVLCPSFYRARIVYNPNRIDRWLQQIRDRVIGWLQDRADEERRRYEC